MAGCTGGMDGPSPAMVEGHNATIRRERTSGRRCKGMANVWKERLHKLREVAGNCNSPKSRGCNDDFAYPRETSLDCPASLINTDPNGSDSDPSEHTSSPKNARPLFGGRSLSRESKKEHKKASSSFKTSQNKIPFFKPPQGYLNKLLTERGYSTHTSSTLDAGYMCRPTSIQRASFGIKLVAAVRCSDVPAVQSYLSAGLSPNAFNPLDESLIHVVCRRGDAKMLRALLNAGASVQVADRNGLCPLHVACQKFPPSFDVIELIAGADVRQFYLMDASGKTPLAYVQKSYRRWGVWNAFLESKADIWWPKRNATVETTGDQFIERPVDLRQLPDPDFVLDVEWVERLANFGGLQPAFMMQGASITAPSPESRAVAPPIASINELAYFGGGRQQDVAMGYFANDKSSVSDITESDFGHGMSDDEDASPIGTQLYESALLEI